MNYARTIALALATALSTVGAASAYTMSPMQLQLEPTGREASGVFRITNTYDRPVAVQTSVFAREMTESGADVLTPAPNDFTVFPPQLIVMPGATQSIKVTYVGAAPEGREKAYRLIAEEVPVPLDANAAEEGGKMGVLVEYVTSLYVAPKGAKPAVRVLDARSAPGGKLELTLSNSGQSHALLTKVALEINGQRVEGEEALEGLLGQNILAGVTRTMTIDMPEGLSLGGPLQAALVTP